MTVSVIFGVHGHCRIPEHGFRPRCRNGHKLRFPWQGIDHGVTDVPEVPIQLFMIDLIIADGGC